MALLDLISRDIIKIPLTSADKDGIITEMIGLLLETRHITEEQKVYDAVLAREALGSTGLESGIAVPHAKTDAVAELTMAIGIAPGGVDFEALDGQPSKLFFLILAPPDQSGPHIEALADIARLTRSKAFCSRLTLAASPEEVVKLFQRE